MDTPENTGKRKIVAILLLCLLGGFFAWAAAPRHQKTDLYVLRDGDTIALPFQKKLNYIQWPSNAPKTVQLLPGMRLRLDSTLIWPDQANTFTPTMEGFKWIVPGQGGPFDSTDLLFLRYLATMGLPPDNSDADRIKQGQGGLDWLNTADNGGLSFYEQFANQKIAPVLASLRMRIASDRSTSNSTLTPASARDWMNEPDVTDFNDGKSSDTNEGRWLECTWPGQGGPKLLQFFKRWNPSYYNNSVAYSSTDLSSYNSAYYQSGESGNQAFSALVAINVDVPVRLQASGREDFQSSYFPFYWSLGDIQKQLGVTVQAVLRRDIYLPQLSSADVASASAQGEQAPIPPLINKADLIRPDHSYMIWFADANGSPAVFAPAAEKAVIEAPKTRLDDFLIAPGDVVYCTDRFRLSDAPEDR